MHPCIHRRLQKFESTTKKFLIYQNKKKCRDGNMENCGEAVRGVGSLRDDTIHNLQINGVIIRKLYK